MDETGFPEKIDLPQDRILVVPPMDRTCGDLGFVMLRSYLRVCNEYRLGKLRFQWSVE